MRITALPVVMLAGAVSISAACSSGGGSAGAGEATITVGFDNPLAYTNNMPVLIAIDQGFFTKRGLKVKTVGFSGGSTATRALVADSINVQAGVGFDEVAGAAKNLQIKIFYTIARDSDFALYGSTAAGVKSVQDLSGKTLGISTFGSYSDFLARKTPSAAGLPASSIKPVALGTNAALFGAIERGTVGGTWNPAGLASQIKGSSIMGTTQSLKIATQYSSLIAKTAWLKDNPGVARKMTEAVAEAIAWHQANRGQAVALAQQQLKLPAQAAEASYDAATKVYTSDGKVSVQGLQAMATAVPQLGLGTKAPETSDLYTDEYLPGAAQ